MQTFAITGNGDVTAFAASPKGSFVFAVAEDGVLYCFSTESLKVEHMVKLHEKEVLGLAVHPHRNIFVSYSNEGTMKIWRPTAPA